MSIPSDMGISGQFQAAAQTPLSRLQAAATAQSNSLVETSRSMAKKTPLSRTVGVGLILLGGAIAAFAFSYSGIGAGGMKEALDIAAGITVTVGLMCIGGFESDNTRKMLNLLKEHKSFFNKHDEFISLLNTRGAREAILDHFQTELRAQTILARMAQQPPTIIIDGYKNAIDNLSRTDKHELISKLEQQTVNTIDGDFNWASFLDKP